jgi:hypothetical protein
MAYTYTLQDVNSGRNVAEFELAHEAQAHAADLLSEQAIAVDLFIYEPNGDLHLHVCSRAIPQGRCCCSLCRMPRA